MAADDLPEISVGPFRAAVTDQRNRGCGFVAHIHITDSDGDCRLFEGGGSDVFVEWGFADQDAALAWARKRLREIAAEMLAALGEEA